MKLKKSSKVIHLTLLVLLFFLFSNLTYLQIIFLNKAYAYAYHEGSSTLKRSSAGATGFLLKTSRNIGGEIRIQTWEKDEVLVEYVKKAKADTKNEAREFSEMIEFDLNKTDDIITLEVSTPRHAPWQGTDKSVRVYLDIFIPKDFKLTCESRYFDYDISGPLKNVQIESNYGKIHVEEVQGETNIETSYGGVEAKNLSGGVNIETSYGPIFLTDVDTQNKTAFLETVYDKIDIIRVKGNIKARTNYSPILATSLELVEGASSFETVYNKIDLKIEELKDCDLYVENTHGNVYLELPSDVSAEISFSIDPGGRIETSKVPILVESIDNTSLEGVIGEGDSKIEVIVGGIGKIHMVSYK
ncbi:MAG: DUF4097 family beta strand repeat-containing protein [Candidatus Zixiibacteriota bacterium]